MFKNKINYYISIPLTIFFIISIITLYSESMSFSSDNIITKQITWYTIGFFIILISTKINFKKTLDYSFLFYIISNILLLTLLFIGTEINGSKCWFIIPGIGSFQPSEFVKLVLILINVKIFKHYDKKHPKRQLKDDIKLFLIIFLITLVPSILTFLQPDTGMVIIYFIITLVMLFAYGIKKSIFIILILIISLLMFIFLYFFFNYENEFINIFGTSFFYRIDRLLDWSGKGGMQISNALAAIKAAGLFGFGIGNTPIYIPEGHTDFIFSVFASNFGFIGCVILIITILAFDLSLIILAKNSKDKTYKLIIIGFLAMILYQQVQNIGMNIGLLPITGITLPFISYGGSSLISYMLGIAIILNYGYTPGKVKKCIRPSK